MSDQNKKTISQRLADKEYMNAWRQFKDDHPVAYGAAAVLPVTGQAAAIADYAGLDYQTEATPTSRYNNQNGQNNQSNMKFMASEVMSLMMFQWWRLGEMLSKF